MTFNQNHVKLMIINGLCPKQNNSKAFNYLGHIYANGFGVKRDYSTAKKYFLLSNTFKSFNKIKIKFTAPRLVPRDGFYG